jgi:hypothetical protein
VGSNGLAKSRHGETRLWRVEAIPRGNQMIPEDFVVASLLARTTLKTFYEYINIGKCKKKTRQKSGVFVGLKIRYN